MDMLVRLPCNDAACDGTLAQATNPVTEGVCWSMSLKCGNCGKTWKYSNDRTDRVHIMKSDAKEELLRKRRARERVKRGVDPDGGRKHHPNRKGHGIKLQNLQRVAAALLNGSSYRQYANEAVLAGDLLVDSRTWERYAVDVWAAAERAGTRTLDRYIVRLCDAVERDEVSGIALSADGAWNKRREANQHCLALLHNGVPILSSHPKRVCWANGTGSSASSGRATTTAAARAWKPRRGRRWQRRSTPLISAFAISFVRSVLIVMLVSRKRCRYV